MSSGLLSYIPGAAWLLGRNKTGGIEIPAVESHDIESSPDKRARCLKHLLKANHVNYSVLYHNLSFDNHNPHILCSAYLLGANENQLEDIFAAESKELEPWKQAPAEVTYHDWRDFLGNKPYQRAFIDFFEDQWAWKFSYQWKKLVEHFLLEGDEPLIHALIGGLGHPLIHLGYAFEMDSKDIALEALAMTCVQYNYLHKYLDEPKYTKPSSFESSSPLELLEKLSQDRRFDGLFKSPGYSNVDLLFEKHESLVLEYWNAWTFENPIKQFQDSQEAAVALLVATVKPGTHAYNFFTVHLLTTSHAVRILLPHLPAKYHVSLVREWWLLVLAVYIASLRPAIDHDYIETDLKGRHWKYVEYQALNSPWATDAHYVKAIRAMREAAMTWGDVHERYLASALTFVDNFHGWVFD